MLGEIVTGVDPDVYRRAKELYDMVQKREESFLAGIAEAAGQAKALVLEIAPDAKVVTEVNSWIEAPYCPRCLHCRALNPGLGRVLGAGDTEEQAWIDAAANLSGSKNKE